MHIYFTPYDYFNVTSFHGSGSDVLYTELYWKNNDFSYAFSYVMQSGLQSIKDISRRYLYSLTHVICIFYITTKRLIE